MKPCEQEANPRPSRASSIYNSTDRSWLTNLFRPHYELMRFTFFIAFTVGSMLFRFGAEAATNSLPHSRYAPVEIRVVDESTRRPLVGAVVSPYCLGGTPYGTKTYRTDTNGFVKAMFIDGGLAAVRVTIAGYQTSNVALLQSNRVVSMRRTER